jgi:DNA-3-methyladenine glycosylase I
MADESGLVTGDDGVTRCFWGASSPDYVAYHDDEWGMPASDEHRLFEKLCLEGFQSGLSWLTILRKRENFRRAFAGFDYERVARFGEKDVAHLLDDAGIVRHRGKIEAAINNAQRALELVETEGSLAAYVWRFEPDPASRPSPLTWPALIEMTSTPESRAMAKDLKKRGWRFVGPTTVYAFMQAMGLVNDHLDGCDARQRVHQARAAFAPPTAT